MTYATRFPWSPPIHQPNPQKHYLQQIDPCQWLGLWANGDQVHHSSNGHNRGQRPIKGYRVSLTAKALYVDQESSIEAARTSDAISEQCGGDEECEKEWGALSKWYNSDMPNRIFKCKLCAPVLTVVPYLQWRYRAWWLLLRCIEDCLSWSVCRWDTVNRVIRHCVTPGTNPETVTERKDYFNKSSEVTDNNSKLNYNTL